MIVTENLRLCDIKNEDLQEIKEVYNSNPKFLFAHMDKDKIDIEWCIKEQEEMKEMNFKTLIIKAKVSGRIIGFIDYCLKEESYLSLLMLHSQYKNKGYGKEIYKAFEDYLKERKVRNIRIDVVYDYDETVLEFWEKRGFSRKEKIQLQWTDKTLDAIVMKKSLE
ncbi:MAG: GNAT family N-acetyltransferase [Clostridiaceae bacterium]|nr:GNAT family N-acetyltransferase [Clostridiaceae bacterium]